MISEQTIEEVKEKASLSDVIAEHVALKRQGASILGLCPFHSEKTPSFHVKEDDGYYYCFGCGASGNVISFIMEMRGLSFPDAIRELAQQFGVEVKEEGSRRSGSEQEVNLKKELTLMCLESQTLYRKSLKEASSTVKNYLRERGISLETINRFGIGFSPSADALPNFLRQKKIEEGTMLSSGYVRRNSRGQFYDLFRERLIFPIFLDKKKIAGFGGRQIPGLSSREADQKYPKYINSPESQLYKKNEILYGIPQAMETIRKESLVYIVEGYMDVVSLSQAGVKNVLATCGTAMTEGHVKRLKNITKKVFILFDGDRAGREAAGRCFSIFINSNIDAAALFLPEEEDPDSIAREKGLDTASYLADLKTEPLLKCFIDSRVRKAGAETARELGSAAKGAIYEDLCKIISAVQNRIERDELAKSAASWLGINAEEKLYHEMLDQNGIKPGNKPSFPTELPLEISEQNRSIETLPRLDRDILHAVMVRKEELTSLILKNSSLCQELHHTTRVFVEKLDIIFKEDQGGDKKGLIRELLQGFGAGWEAHWRKSYDMFPDSEEGALRLFEECCETARKKSIFRMVEALDREIIHCESENLKLDMLQKKLALTKKLRVA